MRSGSNRGQGSGSKTVDANIVQPIPVPLLSSVTQKAVRKFASERRRYLLLVEERNQQPGLDVRALSLRLSIEDHVLEALVVLRQFGDSIDSVDKITEDALSSRGLPRMRHPLIQQSS